MIRRYYGPGLFAMGNAGQYVIKHKGKKIGEARQAWNLRGTTRAWSIGLDEPYASMIQYRPAVKNGPRSYRPATEKTRAEWGFPTMRAGLTYIGRAILDAETS